MNGITIAVPVYNEEEIITQNTIRIIDYMNSLGDDYEVILSLNGCIDKSYELAIDLESKYKQIIVLNTEDKGAGIAFRNSVKKASKDKIICLDMDLPTDFDFVKNAAKLLEENDIVIGSKIMGEQKRSIIRKIGSVTYLKIAKIIIGLPFSDFSISTKAFKRELLLKLLNFNSKDTGTSYVIETVYKAKLKGYKITQIPVQCNDTRKSRFNLFHEAFYRYSHLFKLFFKGLFNKL